MKRLVSKRGSRTTIWLIACIGITFISCILSFQLVRREKRQSLNIVIISIDTLRADHIGVYGYPHNTTPHIDKLAKHSTVFTNAYTSIPATYPSFATLMTGLTPFESGVYYNGGVAKDDTLQGIHPLDPSFLTLATLLKKNGYITGAFVTNYVLNKKLTNLDRGFDEYNYIYNPSWTNRYQYEKFLNSSLQWLTSHKDEHFFLWVHLIDPHTPYLPPAKFRCEFGVENSNEINRNGLLALETKRKEIEGCASVSLPQKDVSLYQTLYDGSIRYSDELTGKILSTINNLGLDKNTVILLYGDHGESFEHGYYFEHDHVLYNSTTNIPIILYDPLLPQGSLNNELIQNGQIFPTLINKLGISLPKASRYLPGITDSYLGGLTKFFSTSDHAIYSMNTNLSKYSIIEGEYKYIISMPNNSCKYKSYSEELYNRMNDKNEENNLILHKSELAKRLNEKLFTFLRKYDLPKTQEEVIEEREKSRKHSSPEQNAIDNLRNLGY